MKLGRRKFVSAVLTLPFVGYFKSLFQSNVSVPDSACQDMNDVTLNQIYPAVFTDDLFTARPIIDYFRHGNDGTLPPTGSDWAEE